MCSHVVGCRLQATVRARSVGFMGQDSIHEGKPARKWRGHAFPWISSLYLILIYGIPTAFVLALLRWSTSHIWATIAAPIACTLLFLVISGLLSLPHQFAVTPGKLRRDVNNRLYFHRRLYGVCWTAVYYNKPAYYVILTIPFLKWMVFRLFGYRGSMNFTVYPDTWIRDLPLLDFEDGVYVSNRATLGTNMVLSNGFLLVGEIKLRAKALVGQLAMLAPGVVLEPGAEVGVGTAIGIKTVLDADSFIAPCCTIEHGVRIGKKAAVGAHSYVGSGSKVYEGVKLLAGMVIAPRTTVSDRSQSKSLEPVSSGEEKSRALDGSERRNARDVEITGDELLVLR
jgi:carbonic anhydrase/acetyltransferase-like protein (isoleucine patch superfamily)